MGSRVPQGAPFAYETAVHSLAEQLRRIDALDSKAGLLLAADGIIVGLVLVGDADQRPTWLALLGGGAVLGSLVFAVLALLIQRSLSAPRADITARLADAPETWIKWRLIGSVLEAIDSNDRSITRKARLLTVGQGALLASLVTLGGYFIGEHLTRGA